MQTHMMICINGMHGLGRAQRNSVRILQTEGAEQWDCHVILAVDNKMDCQKQRMGDVDRKTTKIRRVIGLQQKDFLSRVSIHRIQDDLTNVNLRGIVIWAGDGR